MAFDLAAHLKTFDRRPAYSVGNTEGIRWERNPRDLAVIVACDIEVALKELLRAFLWFLHGTGPSGNAQKDLIGGASKSASVDRLSTLAFRLKLIAKLEYEDLKKIAKLRNKYAHNKAMGAFSALADTCDLIRSCNAHKDIEHAIAKVDAPDKDQAALHTLGAIYVDLCETRADRLTEGAMSCEFLSFFLQFYWPCSAIRQSAIK